MTVISWGAFLMFGFGKDDRSPLADAKAAERWFASLPANDPLAVHGEVLAVLGKAAALDARRGPQVLEAVFRLDLLTRGLRKTLTAQYLEHATRSSRIEGQLWQALFDLAQGFLACYAAFAREVADRAQSGKWQALQPELVARQIAQLAQDGKIRFFRYEAWIPAKWAELHALFTLACSRQIERRPLVAGTDGTTTTIEHEYLIALVMQLVNVGNMTPLHVDWVAEELDEWCRTLRLTLEPSSTTTFYVDLGGGAGLRRRTPAPLEGRVLFLDTRPLHALLLQNIAVLEQKIRSQPLSEKTARRNELFGLVSKLAAQVDPEFRPFARRGERMSAVGTVDAIVGFAKISGYLREEERQPLPSASPGRSFGGTMEIAVFGRSRNEHDRRLEQAQRRLESYTAPGGPWEVKDVSQTGFRLLAPMSVANAVTLGTLAALRPQGQQVWTLGIVRRMRRLTSERAEIGLQIIANSLASVDLVEQRKPQADPYDVNGEATTVNGRVFHGLVLTLRKREEDPGVQSLIMPAVEYQPAKRFKLQLPTTVTAVRLGRLLDQQPDWVWTSIEPLEVPGSAPAPTAARR
jgi:hypothetical protein